MNPWLAIPAADYEAHMASATVGQWEVLARLLGDALARHRPRRLLVVGCGTGNGFHHVDPLVTSVIVGLDLNPQYLDLLHRRHAPRLPGLQLLPGNVLEVELPAASFDLVHAALVLEYVPVAPALARMAAWVAPEGVLSLVLQQPSPSAPAVTPGCESLQALAEIMRLVEPAALRTEALRLGLAEESSAEIPLPQGKSFLALTFRRHGTGGAA